MFDGCDYKNQRSNFRFRSFIIVLFKYDLKEAAMIIRDDLKNGRECTKHPPVD